MARLIVMTDPDTALGFRLAGVEATAVADQAEAAERLLALLRTKESGIVIYNEDYLAAVPEKSQVAMEESLAPIFFSIPVARAAPFRKGREEYLVRLLRRAIGYQLKIKR
jgi:V/A-type H+-transporting ATPase subunit F